MDTSSTVLSYGAVVWLDVVHVYYFFVVAFVVACCYVRDIVMQWRIQLGFPMIHSVHDVLYRTFYVGVETCCVVQQSKIVLGGVMDFRME